MSFGNSRSTPSRIKAGGRRVCSPLWPESSALAARPGLSLLGRKAGKERSEASDTNTVQCVLLPHNPRLCHLFTYRQLMETSCSPALYMSLPVCVLSHFSRVGLFTTPWTAAHWAPLSMGFSRQQYWSGLPCPPPGDLPHSGIEPESLMSPALAGRFFITSTI